MLFITPKISEFGNDALTLFLAGIATIKSRIQAGNRCRVCKSLDSEHDHTGHDRGTSGIKKCMCL